MKAYLQHGKPRKILALLLVTVLTLGMLSGVPILPTARADGTLDPAGGLYITRNANMDVILSDNGVNFCILDENTDLNFTGNISLNNLLPVGDAATINSLHVDGNLEISGTGTLNVVGGKETHTNDFYRPSAAIAVYVTGNLAIRSGKLTGKGIATGDSVNGYGVYVEGGITAEGGTLVKGVLEGSGISAASGAAYGVHAATGDIIVKSYGALTGEAHGGYSGATSGPIIGVSTADKGITVEGGGTLTGNGISSNLYDGSIGVFVGSGTGIKVTGSGSSLTANDINNITAPGDFGIDTWGSIIVEDGGTLAAVGTGFGIFTHNNHSGITVTGDGSNLTATGTGTGAHGVYLENGDDITVSEGGLLTGVGDFDGVYCEKNITALSGGTITGRAYHYGVYAYGDILADSGVIKGIATAAYRKGDWGNTAAVMSDSSDGDISAINGGMIWEHYPNIAIDFNTTTAQHPYVDGTNVTDFGNYEWSHYLYVSSDGTGLLAEFKYDGLQKITGERVGPVEDEIVILDNECTHRITFYGTLDAGTYSDKYNVIYKANGGSGDDVAEEYYRGAAVTVAANPFTRSNYRFTGWNTEPDGSGISYSVNSTFEMPGEDVILYAQWSYNSGSIEPPPTIIEEEDPPLGDLDMDNHFAYIIGYPDGNVRPGGYITREEVATIFFRLLTQEARTRLWSKSNSYNDVETYRWSNNAISTMTNGNILTGYEDGSFKPLQYITRAELATIAARFSSESYSGENKFTDIGGHWAANAINLAAELGYVEGYGDGTFRPDEFITRAEVMTFLNRVLGRNAESPEALLDDMTKWPDNASESAWYYFAVQEATNSHDYIREEDSEYELWTEMVESPDWTALEKANSTPDMVKY